MSSYLIEKVLVNRATGNRAIPVIITPERTDLGYVNGKIKDYAEAWRKEASLVQHHAGQSVVFFKTHYVEFTRISAPIASY